MRHRHEVPLNAPARHTAQMSKPNLSDRAGAPPTKKPLLALTAAIVLAGVGAAWWFQQLRQQPVVHPETALFRRIEEPRVMLAEVFRSQDSVLAISTPLQAAGLTVRSAVLERPPSALYPPRRITTLTVSPYRHLDCEGTLVLEFFNDRLMEADFRPDDAALYAPRLRRAVPGLRGVGTGHAEYLEAPLRVWSSVDLAKSKVGRSLGSEGLVLWQDLRLIAQRDDWDARYGGIPVPASR